MKIGSIWAVGRNYADHAKELNNPVPKEPMIFLKAGAAATQGENIQWPKMFDGDIHHEVELALRFGQNLEFDAMMLALDLTARDLQSKLKSAGHPWTLAKSFRGSCPMSPPIPLPVSPWTNTEFRDARLELKVNNELRQSAKLSDMIFAPQTLAAWVKERFPVSEGDVLLTGTPAGVGALKSGDHLEGQLVGPGSTLWLRQTWRTTQPN